MLPTLAKVRARHTVVDDAQELRHADTANSLTLSR